MFYGDSIVTGWRGTTVPRARWSSLVCDALGWREVTLALDGMGYVRRRGPRDATGERAATPDDTTLLDTAIRLEPDVVVVCLGANDLQLLPEGASEVEISRERDLSRLRRELPDTPVVVTTYFPVAELSPRGRWVEAGVVAACRRHGHTYVDAFRRAVSGDPDLLCDDRVHPNDSGHRALAEAIRPTLAGLSL